MKNHNFTATIYKRILLAALLVFLLYLATGFLLDKIVGTKSLKIAENYFAHFIFSTDDYMKKATNIKQLDGFIMRLDSDLVVLESSQSRYRTKYNLQDLVALQSGEYIMDGTTYYGSVKRLNQNGKTQYGVAVIPRDKLAINHTILNPSGEVNELVIILIISIILFLLAFAGIVYFVSNSLKKQFSNPLNQMNHAFEEIKNKKYHTRLSYHSIDEFNNIRDAFNFMAQKIQDIESERAHNIAKRNQLFSDIGHDIKTPITIIEGYSNALVEERISKDDISQTHQVIRNQARHIKHLANALLDLINYERVDYSLALERTDICELTRLSVIDVLPVLDDHAISIKITIPETPIYLDLDKKLMTRTLINLLTNIAHHNPKGTRAHIVIKKNQDDCTIVFADDGLAINQDAQAHIFDPFSRGDTSRASSNNNNGLGLSIAQRIVQLHGGELTYIDHWHEEMKAFIIHLKSN